jgi:hemolysin III-related protein
MRRYCRDEIAADVAVHLIGMTIGIISAPALLALAARSTKPAVLYSVLAYSIALMAMLTCSALYHLRRSSDRRDFLRRLDHAAILGDDRRHIHALHGLYFDRVVCSLDDRLEVARRISGYCEEV